jgi:hypothetical protein
MKYQVLPVVARMESQTSTSALTGRGLNEQVSCSVPAHFLTFRTVVVFALKTVSSEGVPDPLIVNFS